MKLIHLSDLHLGKRVNGFSMQEDQAAILSQILSLIAAELPDAVLIAGDVYDKSLPAAEAVTLFDDFLVRLSRLGIHVCIISGNHDSPERLAFGGRLLEAARVHLSPVFFGQVTPIRLTDTFGAVNLYLLPFLKPVTVRQYYPDLPIETYTEALQAVISAMQINPAERNVLVTHQFVTGAARSESESFSVGGSDNVDAGVFAPFDYTALGHLHSAQSIGGNVRYCGAPLSYSFGEAQEEKSLTVIELGEKGSVQVRTLPLAPIRAFHSIRGTYMEVTAQSFYRGTTYQTDYMRVILTDEEDVPDAAAKLRSIYRNLMIVAYDNKRTRSGGAVGAAENAAQKTPLELFEELYQKQNNQPMSEEQRAFLKTLIADTWKEDTL